MSQEHSVTVKSDIPNHAAANENVIPMRNACCLTLIAMFSVILLVTMKE